jgi:molecular chaperone HtpG
MDSETQTTTPIAFKAETRQLLDILIHSLYTEREIFVRELVSNASDALTRMSFELLTNRDVLDPDAPLQIRITADPETNTLTITDTGIGMTADEMVANLGTIARSGAREFIKTAKETGQNLSDLIGQFGVGFYSVFMAAEWVRVISRSYRKDAQAAAW